MSVDTSHISLMSIIPGKFKKSGNYHAGACPMCGGVDRFVIKDDSVWLCRQCSPRYSDAIAFMMKYHNVPFLEACDMLNTPIESVNRAYVVPDRRAQRDNFSISDMNEDKPILQDGDYIRDALRFVYQSHDALMSPDGTKARQYLLNRGITEPFFESVLLGFNNEDKRAKFGSVEVWLPRGIIIPHWQNHDVTDLWRVNIRRPAGDPKYIQPAGCSAQGFYTVGWLRAGVTVVMVEGEFDALTLKTALRHRRDYRSITAIATGSAQGSRVLRNVAKLAVVGRVLVAFDADQAGEEAARWWLRALPSARRIMPNQHDIGDMHSAGTLHKWIKQNI